MAAADGVVPRSEKLCGCVFFYSENKFSTNKEMGRFE
jgi:hypothetical protein